MSQIWQGYMCFFLLEGWGKKCEKKTKTLRYEVWGNINAVRRNSFWYISNPFGPSVRFGMFMNLFIFGPRLLCVTLTDARAIIVTIIIVLVSGDHNHYRTRASLTAPFPMLAPSPPGNCQVLEDQNDVGENLDQVIIDWVFRRMLVFVCHMACYCQADKREKTGNLYYHYIPFTGETLRLHTCVECPNNYPWLIDPTGDGFSF